jgi:hypothetical protein
MVVTSHIPTLLVQEEVLDPAESARIWAIICSDPIGAAFRSDVREMIAPCISLPGYR